MTTLKLRATSTPPTEDGSSTVLGFNLSNVQVDENFLSLKAKKLEASSNLSDLANAATARTNLGVAIGVNVQAWDADLDLLAAITKSTGLLKWNGSAWTFDASTYLTASALTPYAPLASPAFTGTPTGITATHVGLGNVTNESKATMFSSPTFTGTVTMPTTAYGNNALSGIKTATFYSVVANSGSTTQTYTTEFANGQKQKLTLTGTHTATLAFTFPGAGHYQLHLLPASTVTLVWPTINANWQWLGATSAPTVNTGTYGGVVNIYYDGTLAVASYSKVGAA